MKLIWPSLALITFLAVCPVTPAQETKRPFTVADDIGLTIFGTAQWASPEIHFSPDGKYVAVLTERGRLDLNCPEESLSFYRADDIKAFLARPEDSKPPSPAWVLTRCTYKEGRNIAEWGWLPDSTGVLFLERTTTGNQRLAVADVRKKSVEPLTSETEAVKGFQARDRDHFVYTLADTSGWKKWKAELAKPAVVGTARPIDRLLFPDDPTVERMFPEHDKHWAVVGKKRFAVQEMGVMSPDGRSMVANVPTIDVPQSWENLYPPPPYNPLAAYDVGIHAGHHDPENEKPGMGVYQYVQIDLATGSANSLTGAPNSEAAGWFWAGGDPSWSNDGKAVLLPHTFVKSTDNKPSRPCVAVVDVASNMATCVEVFKSRLEKSMEEGYHHIDDSRFVDGDSNRVIVTFNDPDDETPGYTEYERKADSGWRIIKQGKGSPDGGHGFDVIVEQGLNQPPKLVAKDKQSSRVIWDPNPQLKNLELGDVSVYTWKDKEGREWEGGLYKPVGYTPGKRYPLVLQTHVFAKSLFSAAGGYTTANAARAFASAGIMVLQMANGKQDCPYNTPEEAACAIDMAEAAANKLVAEGLADPENIGMIGFSATCFQVMEVLTHGSLHLKAASITDGVMYDYMQYMTSLDSGGDWYIDAAKSHMGAAPFGEGLQQWIKRSPGFGLEKVNAALMVVGEGRDSLQSMLQPYAGLRALHKPTELVMLNTDEHILTNPAVRMASQGGSVDWFRFWLQGYEDPDPAKAEQYKRWRDLRKMQAENDKKSASDAAQVSH
jgi:dipeptidyl aminopeptidase/acylaminoacyl peptidase